MSEGEKEQIKLTAAYFNGLAIAVFAVGGLAQVIAALTASFPDAEGLNLWIALKVALVCFLASGLLHTSARVILSGLDE